MNEFWRYLLAFCLWPGLLAAAPLGWFYLWMMRKLIARLQGRRGPPFFQPFFDFMKLLGKRTVVPAGVGRAVFFALPLIALAAATAAQALLPLPGNPVRSAPGDVIFLLYLMEVPVLCEVLAGYVGRSVYGEISAMREALMSLAYNLPMLAAVIALAEYAGSFNFAAVQAAPFGLIHVVAGIGFLMGMPARLKSNPFSIPNAEHEIVADAHIEYNGVPLALFKLSNALEVGLITSLFAVLFVPRPASAVLALVVYFAVVVAVLAGVTLLAASTARLRLVQAFRFYWAWGGAASAAALALSFVR